MRAIHRPRARRFFFPPRKERPDAQRYAVCAEGRTVSIDPGWSPQDPNFWSPKENPWGAFIGGAAMTAGSLFFKRVRGWWLAAYRRIFRRGLQLDALTARVADLTAQVATLTATVTTTNGEATLAWRREMRRDFAMLRQMLSSADVAQFWLDAGGNLEWASTTFQLWTGRSELQLEGRGLFAVIVTAEHSEFRARFQQSMVDGYDFRGDYHLSSRTGFDGLATEWLIEPVRGENDELLGWVGQVERTKNRASRRPTPLELVGGDPS